MRCVWWDKQNNTEEDLWIRDIIAETADKYRILPDHILGPRRSANVVKARHKAMWRARNETNASYLKLARIFKRDHTTVIHGVRCWEAIRDGKVYRRNTANSADRSALGS